MEQAKTLWKVRFTHEFKELKDRVQKLEAMLDKYSKNELDFTPNCSFELLSAQLGAMKAYLNILIIRAKIENIDI